jgi:PKD repeat protein
MKKRYTFFLLLLAISSNCIAQNWITKLNNPNENYWDVKKSFDKYWKKEERKEKFKSFFRQNEPQEKENESFVLYKRWENFVAPRVWPSGNRALINTGNQEIQKLINTPSLKSAMQAGGNWTAMGAFTVPDGGGGAGRLNCVRFQPGNPSIIYVGAPAGGLWKSNDGGNSWNVLTTQLPSLGVSDVAIDPNDNNTLYIATGDNDAGDTYSVGLLKSTDGGINWQITGYSATLNQARRVNRILIHPQNSNVLFIGASNGAYKSIDAGLTWTRVITNGVKDMEFKPGDPNIVYAATSTGFYKSTNGGNTFTSVTNGLPFSVQINRVAIAVTPANPNYVYLLYSSATSSGFAGFYRSVNAGSNFTLMANSPNLLGWDENGFDTDGQGWYTLSVAASPVNADEVAVGGVNIWKTYDGGLSWDLSAHWYGGGGAPYVHADIHDLIYNTDNNILYTGSDGGIFVNDNNFNWTDLSNGLQIGQMYRLGNAATNSNLVVQGWQDNGTNRYLTGNWDHILGGDGMDCFIDWSNANYVYGSSQNGSLNRSNNGGNPFTFTSITNNISEEGVWITPWCQDPITPATIYAGFKNVWKSTNRGNSWTQLGNINSNGLQILKIAKNNPLTIYASDGGRVYKTVDGGNNWTNFSIANSFGTITDLCIHSTNSNTIWASISGYSAGSKVFKSTDGGTTWNNISSNLPNIPANCLVFQNGTDEGLYVGTDLGVYYTDTTLQQWLPFSNGLPNVIIDDLEIQYSSGKLRAATYGRGLWETTIYNPTSAAPYSNFKADTLSGCPGLTIQFTDLSSNNPTSWSWAFENGTPAISSLQNPIVSFSVAGTYNNVTLQTSNSNGSSTTTKNSYINISPQIKPTIQLIGNDTTCTGSSSQLKSSYANSYLWLPNGQTNIQINANATAIYTVTTKDVFGCATTSDPVSIYILPPPPAPSITVSNDTLFSSATSGNQWYINNVAVPGATQQWFIMNGTNASYKVVVTDVLTGCSASSGAFLEVDDITNALISLDVYPNPAGSHFSLDCTSKINEEATINLNDITGRLVQSQKTKLNKGKNKIPFQVANLESGVYIISVQTQSFSSELKVVIKNK